MYGFIVAACLREQVHKESLTCCLNSIKEFHENVSIVVVVDYTSEQQYISELIKEYPTVIFETNTPSVPADMLLLYYFKLKKYFQKAILLQDSMAVISKVDITKTHDLDYLWHFNNHRVYWHIIAEPDTEFNRQHKIITHDNLVEYCIYNLIKSEGFKTYCIQNYHDKYKWSGCFGCLCIIDYDFLCKLDAESSIIDLMSQMKDNRLRRAIESLFSLACQYVLKKEIYDSYDGLYYDGNYHNNFIGNFIVKKSFNRQ
jgi:hypothetical protein